jgi:hypothetical protein
VPLDGRSKEIRGLTSVRVDFPGAPQEADVICPSYLGQLGEFVGIRNVRFGQVVSDTPDQPPVDPGDIDAALQRGDVPKAASILVWLGGLSCVGLAGKRRIRRSA